MGPVRMAVVGTSHADLQAKLERAIKRLGDERTRNIKEIEGIYHFREPLGQQGKLAFLFPGEGSQYRNMLGDLCIHFPEVRRTFDLMDRAYENHPRDYLPSDVIFPPPLGSPSQERLYNMDSGAETVFCANQALYALIENLGIRPDAMVGHSTGEHSALLASRVVDVHGDEELIRHILGVYEVFDKLNSTQRHSGSGAAGGGRRRPCFPGTTGSQERRRVVHRARQLHSPGGRCAAEKKWSTS